MEAEEKWRERYESMHADWMRKHGEMMKAKKELEKYKPKQDEAQSENQPQSSPDFEKMVRESEELH